MQVTTTDIGNPVRLADVINFNESRLLYATELPPAEEYWRGKQLLLDGAGADGIWTCVQLADGTFAWVRTPQSWEDLRFPVQGINPVGGTAPPTIDNALASFPGSALFSGAAINVLVGFAQMPHAWAEGTPIVPHLHWARTVTASDGVTWEFYYRRSNPGAAWEGWQTPISVTDTTAPGTLDNHRILSFGPIVMTGYTISSLINWQVWRRGDTDASAAQARLFEFDIHYLVDSPGSTLETTK